MAKGEFQRLANRAQEQDLLRQKQIQNQITIINRLLDIIQRAKLAVHTDAPKHAILTILEGAPDASPDLAANAGPPGSDGGAHPANPGFVPGRGGAGDQAQA